MNPRPILLVEDNLDDQELTLRAFRRANLANQILLANDGVEALDLIYARGAHAGRALEPLPALILLDLNLPRLDGVAVLKALRAEAITRLLPVVVLTSSKEDEDRLRCYQQGANSYVRKPVDFVAFTEAVRQLGMYWLAINEPPPDVAG